MSTTFVARAKPYRATLPHDHHACSRCGITVKRGRPLTCPECQDLGYCRDCRSIEHPDHKD